jgi:capsular exopolysaccharide synthesis family protein
MSILEEPRGQSSSGSLRGYLDVIRRRKWIIAATTAVAIAAAAGFTARQPSVYQSETKIVIGQGQSLFQIPNGNVIQPFTATMSDLLKSHIVATRVIRELGLHDSPEGVLGNLHVSINPDTAVITARYDSTDPQRATRVLQQVAQDFSQLVRQRFGEPGQQPGRAATSTTPPITATVFDPAHPLPGQVSPRPVRNLAVAAVLGLLLGLIGAFLREHFDRGLRRREDVEQAYGAPVIGQIPFRRSRNGKRTVAWEGTGEIAEAYRGLRANLQYLAVQRPLRTILVTSATPEQGKTTVAANLAVAIARSGASCVVIEADLRRPRLDTALEVPPIGPGLTSVLVGSTTVEDALRPIELPDPGAGQEAGRIAFVASGPLPPNPSELLSSTRMRDFLDEVSALFDYVLIDSPPVLPVADALELARNVDGVLFAVRRNRATSDEAREVRAMVDRLGIHLVGVVFTDVPPVGGYGVYGDAVAAQPEHAQPAGGRSLERPQPVVTKEG